MEAVAFYHFKYAVYPQPWRILFLSVGSQPNPAQFRWIAEELPVRDYRLAFGDTLPDKAGELITAAALSWRRSGIALEIGPSLNKIHCNLL
jgi:hypothetical protein